MKKEYLWYVIYFIIFAFLFINVISTSFEILSYILAIFLSLILPKVLYDLEKRNNIIVHSVSILAKALIALNFVFLFFKKSNSHIAPNFDNAFVNILVNLTIILLTVLTVWLINLKVFLKK